ncbi:minor capsid protein [Eubacterium barkeri]|uniref:Minor capsid protein n=1 Tax=Eubacterium barkeri TaxID=1528 RepID=A0A1H3HD16_EUBBA|nr:minor capsid protein [Eubacterium barkeri]SDY13220.1 Minor capsid protein [Eubacterium barkeri]
MKAKVKIELYSGKIRQLEGAWTKALEMAAEAIYSDVIASQIVPFDVGTLEGSGYVKVDGQTAHIVFDTPYARRLYFHPEYNFRQDKNPNARGRWMDDYQVGYPKEGIALEAQKIYFKKNAGGLVK